MQEPLLPETPENLIDFPGSGTSQRFTTRKQMLNQEAGSLSKLSSHWLNTGSKEEASESS